MSKNKSETLRYPTDTEHREAVTQKRDELERQIEFFAMENMDEVNAFVIYKFFLLRELLQSQGNIEVSHEKLMTLDSFRQFIDEISQTLPYVGSLNLAIESLQYLLDPKKWREYVEGGEALITG